MLLKHAWKELGAEPRFALLFLFNLALGLSGLVTMEAFRSSLTESLRENARSLLAADLALSTRRPLTEKEKEVEEALAARSELTSSLVETFSMVAAPSGSRLVSLRAVGENYPLRGYLELESQGRLGSGEGHRRLGDDQIWIDPDLARQLGLEPGASLQLGAARFTVNDFIAYDPTQSFRGLAMAGRIVLSREGLERTGLIRQGSTVTYVNLYRFSDSTDPEALAKEWAQSFPDPAVRLRSAQESAENSTRMLGYLGDFLGLAALVALFLSSLGSSYLFRTWLVRRSRVLALHQVLGLNFREAAAIPALQALALAALSVPLALLLGKLELLALSWMIRSFSPVEIQPALSLSSAVVAFAVAALGSLLLALPFLVSLRAQSPRELLGGKIPEPRFSPGVALFFLPAALLLYLLAFVESQSFRTAGLFFGALLVSLLALFLAGAVFLKFLRALSTRWKAVPWTFRHALLQLSRKGFNSISAFVALALGALLLNLLPQLRHSLLVELEDPGKSRLPSLFLFDIQEEQLSPLQSLLKEKGAELDNLSPMVRARLLTVNGNAFERQQEEGFRTREEEAEARSRNRGYNLTYRQELSEAEEIVKGRPFSPEGTNEVSVEQRFAGRLGLNLGDELLFDVQGVEVLGKIVNFRKVRWTSFQPNFFVLFQDGVLNGAPKIFLGSLPEMPLEKKEALQNALALQFPNVSAVDVRATIARALDLADRMRWSLNLMSAISLFAGFVVLYSIANRQAELRRWDINLCKVLGAGRKELRQQQLFEFGILSFFSAFFGAALSVAFAWTASFFLFEGVFRVDTLPLLLSVAGTTCLGIAVSWAGAYSVWNRNPAELLQDQPL